MGKSDAKRGQGTGAQEEKTSETTDQQIASKPRGPAQTEPTQIADQWRLEKIYQDPAHILLPQPKVKSLLSNCAFVFDTSALLTPYESDTATIIEIKRVLEPLAAAKRLFVPQRALREFANNRGTKITETATTLLALRHEAITIPPLPFLGNMRTAEALKTPRDNLEKQIKNYQSILDGLIDDIRSLNYDDPVSELYRGLFPAEQIIKSDKTREELEEDYKRRVQFQIPPGYEDKHIGDLVIWHSILDHGERTKRNTVFISNDIKEDWAHKIGEKEHGQMVAARYELVYEYFERTKGAHYAQLQFADLLKHLKASDEAIRAVEASQRAALASGEDRSRATEPLTAASARRISVTARHRVFREVLDSLESVLSALQSPAPSLGEVHKQLYYCTLNMGFEWWSDLESKGRLRRLMTVLDEAAPVIMNESTPLAERERLLEKLRGRADRLRHIVERLYRATM